MSLCHLGTGREPGVCVDADPCPAAAAAAAAAVEKVLVVIHAPLSVSLNMKRLGERADNMEGKNIKKTNGWVSKQWLVNCSSYCVTEDLLWYWLNM